MLLWWEMHTKNFKNTYGRYTIIKELDKRSGHRYVQCLCSCGVKKRVRLSHLVNGKILSCGCYSKYKNSTGRTGIGGAVSKTRLYKIWQAMKERCYNPKNIGYKYYGGKNIGVCVLWKSNYKNFHMWALSNGYRDGLTIDRVDSNKDYEPDNCRWVTKSKNNSYMCEYHIKKKSGAFSKKSFDKVRETNISKQGRQVEIYEDNVLIITLRSLGEAAEFIKEMKSISTSTINLKKNISACLHGKRKTCYGYTFK